jgi:hypothetical protein
VSASAALPEGARTAIGASTPTSSAMEAKRSSGRLASARSTTSSSAAGAIALSDRSGGGGELTCSSIISPKPSA